MIRLFAQRCVPTESRPSAILISAFATTPETVLGLKPFADGPEDSLQIGRRRIEQRDANRVAKCCAVGRLLSGQAGLRMGRVERRPVGDECLNGIDVHAGQGWRRPSKTA